jgi:argininosuccinate lyase
MKLWEEKKTLNQAIEKFTIGKDRELDLYLAPFDIAGSLAHIKMLESVGLLSHQEWVRLEGELKKLYSKSVRRELVIEEGVEDIHSQIEIYLTEALGDVGKKIHSGRSRNDQVLVDLKLFMREAINEVAWKCSDLADLLIRRSFENKDVLMPGYTHLQVAMPSSFGLWFGAYAESLADDLQLLLSAYKIVNQNPLGSAAGYGSSFPLNRKMTTELLGFESLNYNVIYAQMGRGKTEKIVSYALANIASTLSKFAFDVCLFMSQNFGFVSLPDEFTTGSSIMPHKKNPDVFELIRAKCNKLQAMPQQIITIANNLPSGYFRDLQIIKEIFLPSFDELMNCMEITLLAVENISINKNILNDSKYNSLFSVEEVNKRVQAGIPFRDAYKQVREMIQEGNYKPEKRVTYTHEGSIGNLCLDEIKERKNRILTEFNFLIAKEAIRKLTT